MELNCISCDTSILQAAIFCHNCGSQQKCKSCQTPLVKGANNCIGCGISVSKSSNDSRAINTVEFKETATERGYKMAFSDEVGSNMVSLMQTMLENQSRKQFIKLDSTTEENSHRLDKGNSEEATIIDKNGKEIPSEESDFPHIDDLGKSLDCSEYNWMLIYAFYFSNYGKGTLDRSEVLAKKKDVTGTSNHFPANWNKLISDKYIRTIRDGVFQLTDKGSVAAIAIIQGNQGSSVRKSAPKKTVSSKKEKAEPGKKASKTGAKSIKPEEFEAFEKGKDKPSLEDFIKGRSVNTDKSSDTILAIAYYISNYCKTNFTDGNIEYAYKILKLPTIVHLRQTIINQRTNHAWFSNDADGKWVLDRAGSAYFEKNFPSK